MSFTARVREELAHTPVGPVCCRTAETAAMVRLGGALQLTGAGPGWVVDVGVGAVARRLHTAFVQLYGARADIEVHQPTGLRTTRYRLVLAPPAGRLLRRLGVLGGDLRPVEEPPEGLVAARHDAAAFLRGALMVAGSISDPRRPAHLEVRVPSSVTAAALQRLLTRCGAAGVRAAERDDGWRVFAKGGPAIGAVLASTGAHGAFLEWDAERLRRELRGEANRATNADRANLSRAVGAAARQVAGIEGAVARLGWGGLPDGLRETALARLANPEASLAELGALHDPAVGKATVHRRLLRISELAAGAPRESHGPDG